MYIGVQITVAIKIFIIEFDGCEMVRDSFSAWEQVLNYITRNKLRYVSSLLEPICLNLA